MKKLKKDIWKDWNKCCVLFLKNGKIAVWQKDMVISNSEEVTEKDLIEKNCTNESFFNDFIYELFNSIGSKKKK